MPPPAIPSVPIWDLGVRVFHWALVAAVTVLALTGFGIVPLSFALHLAVGYGLIGLMLFRLVWGVWGGSFARFRSFAFGPRAVLRHLRDMAAGRDAGEAGHNPLGAQMVFALLAVLAALIVTGMVALGGADKQGPLAFAVAFATGETARAGHRLLAFGLLALVGLHLLGVAFESWRSRRHLVAAMWHGRGAPGPASHDIRPPNGRRAAVAVALLAVVAVPAWIALAAKPGLGVPKQPLPAQYREACGECHTPHHPSLASAATWAAVMAGLDRHFGEDAGLSPEMAQTLSAYLAAHAAETADTRAARRIGAATAPDTLRITATAYWKERHAALPPELMRARAIGSAANCAACHRDADTGRFQPQSIRIPKETAP